MKTSLTNKEIKAIWAVEKIDAAPALEMLDAWTREGLTHAEKRERIRKMFLKHPD